MFFFLEQTSKVVVFGNLARAQGAAVTQAHRGYRFTKELTGLSNGVIEVVLRELLVA